MNLWQTLAGKAQRGAWCALGGGGKTSLLTQLGREAAHSQITTTTKMFLPGPESGDLRFVVGERLEGGKFTGPPREVLENLALDPDLLLVEADGSRQRPLKLHAPHEPQLLHNTGLVLVVVGMAGWGRAVEEVVHRWELAFEFGQPAEEQVYARVLQGLLDASGDFPRVVVCNQADRPLDRERAARLAPGQIWRSHGQWGFLPGGSG